MPRELHAPPSPYSGFGTARAPRNRLVIAKYLIHVVIVVLLPKLEEHDDIRYDGVIGGIVRTKDFLASIFGDTQCLTKDRDQTDLLVGSSGHRKSASLPEKKSRSEPAQIFRAREKAKRGRYLSQKSLEKLSFISSQQNQKQAVPEVDARQ
ncbi:hypothetical protein NA56DRAFT_719834 [Hyaloscypha hepaticicola]|uniref:Uncharacterized protein n=1 Tax=Hyaloscypha hepaticicola TaxID=2082293 RepID=A0A2J6Q5Q5_9HELO|nr:hypothetical protein NA56DRAFT_719834 [Hyaloscypha hepaticicola]